MTTGPEPTPRLASMLHDGIRAHPWITAVMVGGVLIGAAAGYVYLTDEWSALRRLAAGAVGGFWVSFLLTATRMMGAFPR
jgi:hypothetical protein